MATEQCVLVSQLSLTLCSPMDCSPPGSSVHGISQARILKWVSISFSRGYGAKTTSNLQGSQSSRVTALTSIALTE